MSTSYFTCCGQVTTYSGAGYVQNLHFQKNVTEAMLAELKSNLWLDRGTRFLTLDFTVYNGNVNLFAVVKLYFEFPATGGIFPRQAEIEPIRILYYPIKSQVLLFLFVSDEVNHNLTSEFHEYLFMHFQNYLSEAKYLLIYKLFALI